MERKELQTCYARYDNAAGILTIGNSRIEKVIQQEGCRIRTCLVRDLENGTMWGSPDAVSWQRCPMLTEEDTVRRSFTQYAVEKKEGCSPYLEAVLTLKGRQGETAYHYRVFPGLPFISARICVEAFPGAGLKQGEGVPQEKERITGIESEKRQLAEQEAGGENTLEYIPLGHRHLELEAVLLADKTDGNDYLAQTRKLPVYSGGTTEAEGSIFILHDYQNGSCLLLAKDAPCPSSQLHRVESDLCIQGNRAAVLRGSGVDYAGLPEGKVWYYGSTVGVGRSEGIHKEYRAYGRALFRGDPSGDLFIMSNTWGDRNQDQAICEEFLLKELSRAGEIGVDIVQIDDGWECGITANSKRSGGGVWEGYYSDSQDFWKVNPERFPHGLEAVTNRAAELGIEIGLWFSPDSSNDFANYQRDIETIWSLYQKYRIRYYKLDGVKIRSKTGERRFYRFMDTLLKQSSADIRFNLDVTAEDRFGYLFHPRCGTLFVENRYTDWGNYYPHNTLRNLWCLSAVLPARRLQMELLNNRRNPKAYAGMPFAPGDYSIDYLFAAVMTANPLVWMEMTGLETEDVIRLNKVVSVYKKHSRALFEADIWPAGQMPNGMSFTGFCCEVTDTEGYLLLFRETTADAAYRYEVPCIRAGSRTELLISNTDMGITCRDGAVEAEFAQPRSYAFYRYGNGGRAL